MIDLKKGLLAGLLTLGLVGCGEPAPVETNDSAVEVESVVENTIVQEKTFGITPAEFSSRLSAEAKEVGLGDFASGDFDIREGEVNDGFTEILSDAIAMNGTVDKNGELKSVTFIMGQTDNGDTEIMNMMMIAGLSARAISPDQPKEQSAGALTEVVVDAVQQYGESGDGEASKTVGDIKYTGMANGQLGIWAVIEPV